MGRLKQMPARLASAPSRLSAAPMPNTADEGRRSKDWLNTSRWQRLRKQVLARDGYTCRQTGVKLVGRHPAPNSPVVDHIVPHRGDPALFWDEANLQAVSKAWHDGEKQSREKRGLA